ncbi:MAG: indolepyruvate oxidoreductase subunit beta [Candidatus Ranarchaeia archaeon]
MKTINIIIAGVGGQGNLLASHVVAKAAVNKGIRVITSETFGASQRGGAVASHIRLSEKPLGPVIPEGQCDILIGFEPLEGLRYAARFLNENGTAIVNTRQILPMNAIIGSEKYPQMEDIIRLIRLSSKRLYTFNATDLAVKAGNALAMNMVMVGALIGTGLTPITRDDIIKSLKTSVKPKTVDMNIKAIDYGIQAVKDTK